MALTPHKRSLVAHLVELFPSHPSASILAHGAVVLGLAEHEQQMLQDLSGVVGSPVDALTLVLLARLQVGPAPEPEPEPVAAPTSEPAPETSDAAPAESSEPAPGPTSLQGSADAVALPPADASA